MSAETYLNTPPKGCSTCLFVHIKKGSEWTCGKTSYTCESMRAAALSAHDDGERDPECDHNFSGWIQKPPRRSLLRWIIDTFFKL